MKFTFPMAFTATVLAWSILEYGDQMTTTKQLDLTLDGLRWITDFLIAAHPSDNVLYIQVSPIIPKNYQPAAILTYGLQGDRGAVVHGGGRRVMAGASWWGWRIGAP